MMIVMVVMTVVMQIRWWGQVSNQRCSNNFIYSHTSDFDFSSDFFVVIVVIATVVAIIIHGYIFIYCI